MNTLTNNPSEGGSKHTSETSHNHTYPSGSDSFNEGDLHPINTETKKPYNGQQGEDIRRQQLKNGYESNEWGTFLCWKKQGRSINKGEKGMTCFYPTYVKTNTLDDEGNVKMKRVLKYFTIFNKSQTTTNKS